jgi:hypothetical protein
MYEDNIKSVPYFCSLFAEIIICRLIFKKNLNMKIYQIALAGAALF